MSVKINAAINPAINGSDQLDKLGSKQGQTAVEVILMIAFVAGIMTFITPILDTKITEVVGKVVGAVNTVGWTGGYAPISPEKPLAAHYDGSKAAMGTK